MLILQQPSIQVNQARQSDGNTALHLAGLQFNGNEAIVSRLIHMLIKKGADVNRPNKNDMSALFLALHNGCIRFPLFLITFYSHMIDLNKPQCSQGLTALH
jgi:ankyrin repeat protein